MGIRGRPSQLAPVRSQAFTAEAVKAGLTRPGLRLSISADGRYVAFDSTPGSVAAGDTFEDNAVFVRDLRVAGLLRLS